MKVLVKSLGITPVYKGETIDEDAVIDDTNDHEIEEIKKEFELVKQECKQLVLDYLRDPKTSSELRGYLITNNRIRNLMQDVLEYHSFCVESHIIKQKGMIFDESYQ
jgi:predicted methyltransferase MtxX (methanogen marker protein 4)